MPAHKRVSNEEVRNAIMRREGNVTAAAEDVGMARQNFRRRLQDLGIEAATLNERSPGPLTSRPRRHAPVRLRAAHELLLREAKYDLAAKLRRDVDEAGIAAAFFEEAFAEWLERKLTAKGNP